MFTRMLIALDGSPGAEAAAEVGLALAARHGAAMHLTYVAFVLSDEGLESEWSRTDIRRGEDLLEHWARVGQARGLGVQTRVTRGPVAEAIVREAQDAGCDLLVLGTHGRAGVERLLLGSVAEGVSRRAAAPVLLVRSGAPTPLPWARVLVAVDGGPTSAQTLLGAADLARACGGAVDVVTVLPGLPPPMVSPVTPLMPDVDLAQMLRAQEAYAETVLDQARRVLEDASTAPVAAEALRAGAAERVSDVIVRAARERNSDAVVLGAHGSGGLGEWLLGSVAQRVTHGATVPVLLMRGAPGRPLESGGAPGAAS